MPIYVFPKNLKMRRCNVTYEVKGGIIAICWKGKREMHVFTIVRHVPSLSNYMDKEGIKSSAWVLWV